MGFLGSINSWFSCWISYPRTWITQALPSGVGNCERPSAFPRHGSVGWATIWFSQFQVLIGFQYWLIKWVMIWFISSDDWLIAWVSICFSIMSLLFSCAIRYPRHFVEWLVTYPQDLCHGHPWATLVPTSTALQRIDGIMPWVALKEKLAGYSHLGSFCIRWGWSESIKMRKSLEQMPWWERDDWIWIHLTINHH